MRILMITQDHLMIDRRILQEAKSLSGQGYNVTLLAGFECPGEESYEYFGVHIHRFAYTPQILKPVRRFASSKLKVFCEFLGLSRLWMSRYSPFEQYIRRIANRFPADVIHVHDLPLLGLAFRVAKEWGAKLVYDAHEIYYVHHSISSSIKRKLQAEEKRFARKADLFITVNDLIADYFEQNLGRRPLVLMNCAEGLGSGSTLDSCRQKLRQKIGAPQEAKVVLYQGWISRERNIESLVKAGQYLPQNIHIVIVGYGDYLETLRTMTEDTQWAAGRLHFLGRIENEALKELTSGADLGVIPYQPVDINHRYSSPNKFFEYISSGVPILAESLPFFEKMKVQFGVVETTSLGTPEGMASAIINILSDDLKLSRMRSACLEASKILNWTVESRKLISAYENITSNFEGGRLCVE